MNIFLLVSPLRELKKWGTIFSQTIEKNGGRVLFFNAVDQATNYLRDPKKPLEDVKEVITDSFGSVVDGSWREVQKAALERDIKTTLVTTFGKPAKEEDLEKVSQEGVNIIDSVSFDIRGYAIDLISPQNGSNRERE